MDRGCHSQSRDVIVNVAKSLFSAPYKIMYTRLHGYSRRKKALIRLLGGLFAQKKGLDKHQESDPAAYF